jgi:hypothetical protein
MKNVKGSDKLEMNFFTIIRIGQNQLLDYDGLSSGACVESIPFRFQRKTNSHK